VTDRLCEGCGLPIVGGRSHKRFHDDKCRMRAARAPSGGFVWVWGTLFRMQGPHRMVHVCEGCGVPIEDGPARKRFHDAACRKRATDFCPITHAAGCFGGRPSR